MKLSEKMRDWDLYNFPSDAESYVEDVRTLETYLQDAIERLKAASAFAAPKPEPHPLNDAIPHQLTPQQYLEESIKHGPSWQYVVKLHVRFRDNPVVSEANNRLQRLFDLLNTIMCGYKDSVSGAGCLGVNDGWDEEVDRHSSLQNTEVEIIPDWNGKSYKKSSSRKERNNDTRDDCYMSGCRHHTNMRGSNSRRDQGTMDASQMKRESIEMAAR